MTATETICRCGSGLPADDDDSCIVCWFGSTTAQAPRTMHPTSHDMPLSPAMRLAVSGAATEALMRRRDRSYTPQELRNEQNADCRDDAEVCETCQGTGWYESDCREYAIECPCQVVS